MTDAPSAPSRRPLVLTVLTLLLAAALFGGGYYLGTQPIGNLRTTLSAAERARDDARLVALVQSARASLYQAAADLDRRNFGTANTNVQNAAATLARVPGEGAPEGLADLQRQVAGTNLNVAVDLRQQRAAVLDFADRVTRLAADLPALPGSR